METDRVTSQPPASPTAPWKGALEVAPALGTLAVALVAVRVVTVAGGSVEVANDVLRYIGYANAALGILVSFVPIVLKFIIVWALVTWALLISEWPAMQHWSAGPVLFLLLAVASAFTVSDSLVLRVDWMLWVGLVVLVGGLAVRPTNARLPDGRLVHQYLGFIISFVAALVLLTAPPWMTPEEVQFLGEPDPVVGYFLGESAGWVHVLRDSDRLVIHREADALIGRSPCRLRDAPMTLDGGNVLSDEYAQPPLCDDGTLRP